MLGGEKRGQENLSKRKQTVLQLLDVLRELQDDDLNLPHRKSTALLDVPNEGPNVDEQIQKEGALAFTTFQRRVQDLDRELQNFSNAITTLGSSVGLLSSSFRLRQRLTRILFLVRENAADLFPRKIRRENNAAVGMLQQNFRIRAKMRYKIPPNVARPHLEEDEIDSESFPAEIAGLAQDTIQFASCLNEFPEFCDEAVNASIMAFEHDLKYWASCLGEFEGQFRFPGVVRYVHDLSTEIGEHFQVITSALVQFVQIGVPTIKFSQEHGSTNLLNLSTIATFFSAVTATTLQFSFDQKEGKLFNLVNAFWYSSLVFSIASAVNSLVGVTWRQAMYRSPGHRVPWFVTIWIKQSPLVFLVISVAAFSVGLCLFTWATDQPDAICILITVFTCCSSFGLLAFSCWFIFERVVYAQHDGHVWLDDVISEVSKKIRKATGMDWMRRVPPKHIKKASISVARGGADIVRNATRRASGILPMHSRSRSNSMQSPIPGGTASPVPMSPNVTFAPIPEYPPSSAPASPVLQFNSPLSSPTVEVPPTPSSETGPPKPEVGRFRNAVRSVMLAHRSSTMSTVRPTRDPSLTFQQSGTATEPGSRRTTIGQRRQSLAPLTAGRLARIAGTRGALNQVGVSQLIPVHQALVRNLAFSPNGKHLATCSWDRTSAILTMADLTSHRILAHPHGFVGQVMWSPNGSLLLTKLTSGITVWTAEGVCKTRIDRRTAVHGVTWFASGDEFLSIETNEAVHLDMQGRIIDKYPFDRLKLHDIAITKDGERFFAVATLEHSRDGYKPVKARSEKRIVVYNRLEKFIENQVPVLHDVRDITLSHDDRFALVSYENKAPPQLWRVDMVKDDARLVLAHTYMPNQETDFAGPSYFGGKNDQMVFCASKGGDIHVWDRESGALLHHYPPQMSDGDLTCIAWNSAAEGHVFCTGSHDGTVRLWQPGVTSPGAGGVGSVGGWRSPVAEGGGGEGTPRVMTDEPEALETVLKQRLGAIATELRGEDQSDENDSEDDEDEEEDEDDHNDHDDAERDGRRGDRLERTVR